MNRRIYLASSWRALRQPAILAELRAAGHEVYDFRNPAPGERGFAWSEIDPHWQHWTTHEYIEALKRPIAQHGHRRDQGAMEWADTCVLLLPSGRSAHIEAGWCQGSGRPTLVLALEPCEPELMYRSLHGVYDSISGLLAALDALPPCAVPTRRYASAPEELTALLLERFEMDAADLDFAIWFLGNADFGPAHEDVFDGLVDRYEREKGVKLSQRIDWRKEDL